MYPIVVSDFDETLINEDLEIPTSTVMLIDTLRREGVKFVIATGRAIKSVLDYNHDFIFTDYIISSNGAYIYDVVKDKVLYKRNILVTNVKKIVNHFHDRSIIYLTDDCTWNLISDHSAYEEDYDVVQVNDVDEFIASNKNNIYKIELYFLMLEEAQQAIMEIEQFHLKINVNLQFNEHKFLIEITHHDVNKLEGLKKIAAKHQIRLDQILAFGDGYNDLELLQNVGCGVAVDNALPEVKQSVSDITLDHNHKGVENYLRKVFER